MQTVPVNIPRLDPMPLPGPAWLFTTLLLLTFSLHVIAMNSAVGGGAWTLWNYIRGRNSEHPYSRRLANELARMLPTFLAFAVTLGVAALLFVQVLFGQFLYSSSILIGLLWFAVVPLVMLAYYGYYYVSYTAEQGRARTAVVMACSLGILLTIGFIFSNNMTLMLTPDRWLSMYRAHPNGWNLNLGERSLLPRYLHIMNGAVALFSAILAHLGMRKMKLDFDYGRWLVQRASIVYAICTGGQFVLGMWLLLSFPRPVVLNLLRTASGGAVLGCALITVIASMLLMLLGSLAEKPTSLVNAGFGLSLVTVGLMVGLRHLVRLAFLQPYLTTAPARPQTGVILLFFVLFVAGLATVGYMMMLVGRARRSASVPVQAKGHVVSQ